MLCRAILDAVEGEPGCADGRIIRTLLQTGIRNEQDVKGLGVEDGPLRGGCFGCEPLRLAFDVQQQNSDKRMAESGFMPARALLDLRRARITQRLFARPRGGQGPEEILERVWTLTSRLKEAARVEKRGGGSRLRNRNGRTAGGLEE